jgi:hypothetical protein
MIDQIKKLLSPEASVGAKLTVISMFFGKMFEKHDERIVSLEERQLQRGEKGEKGEKGPVGERGKDGKNGINGKDGVDGKDGKDGKNGIKGKDGVGVKDVTLAADSHLVMTMTDGREIDAGDMELVMGKVQHIISTQLPNNQVYVSATAPSNPSLNDLWLDIS